MLRRTLSPIVLALVVSATAQAEVLTQTRRTPGDTWAPLARTTVGLGFELASEAEKREYLIPLIVEYNYSEQLQFAAETTFGHIRSYAAAVGGGTGLGDTDLSVSYEFLRERRSRPGLTARFESRVPTATNRNLGAHGFDWSPSLIISKDFVYLDVDVEAKYTRSGDPDQGDTIEAAFATEIPLTWRLALVLETVATVDVTRPRARSSANVDRPGGGNKVEATVGFGWEQNGRLKYEAGIGYDTDAVFRIVFGVSKRL